MPITTRAGARAGAHRSTPGEDLSTSTVSFQAINEHLRQAQAGFRSLADQLQSLSEENERLQLELETARRLPASIPRRAGKSRSDTEDDTSLERIRALETEVKALQADNLKKKRTIKKYKKKEFQKELKDLGQSEVHDENGEGADTVYKMRKLLRKFCDLMIATTIADGDECPVCLDALQLKKCSALTCQHILCHNCLPKVSVGADETVMCAECRKPTPRDEVELIHMTERDRWDRLLEIAQAWDPFDVRGEEESSEEEAQEEFIDDDMGTSDSDGTEVSSEGGANETRAAGDDGDEHHSPNPTPPPKRNFAQSPMKEKRKMMEQLAEQARLKRRR